MLMSCKPNLPSSLLLAVLAALAMAAGCSAAGGDTADTPATALSDTQPNDLTGYTGDSVDASVLADAADDAELADAATALTNPGDATADALQEPDSAVDVEDAAVLADGEADATDAALYDSVPDVLDVLDVLDVPDVPDVPADALLDATQDAAKDAANGAAVDANVDADALPSLPDLPYDPTVYTPLVEYANPGWAPPAGMQSSAVIGCDPDSPPIPGKLIDVLVPSGIDLYRDDTWPAGTLFEGYEVREGGGHAIGDFNGDGRLDIYFAIATGPERLYLGQPSSPWKFKGFTHNNQGKIDISAVAADLDGDGDLDLIVGGVGVRMYRNDGPNPYTGVTFTDVTAQAGLTALADLPYFATAVGDLDRDGWLDILISPLKFESPLPGAGMPGFFLPILLRGKGGLTFEDVSSALPPLTPAPVYVASLVDLDNDGDLDIYFGRDFGQLIGPNQLLRNDLTGLGGALKFTNVSVLSGADVAGNTMGLGLGDYDRDGRIDILMSGWQGNLHMLHNNTQPGKKPTFIDTTTIGKSLTTGPSYASWGVHFVDLDNDGWLDLLVPNGHLTLGMGGDFGTFESDGSGADSGKPSQPGGQPGTGGSGGGAAGGDLPDNPESQYDNFYRANGDGTFTDWSVQSGFHSPAVSRGVTQGDFDRDGWPDLVLGTVKGAPKLYRNGCGNAAWLHILLKGQGGNRQGIGARITVVIAGITYIRDIEAGSTSVWSSGEAAAHFGLGTAIQADTLTVAWPSGKVQEFKDIPLRRRLLISEP